MKLLLLCCAYLRAFFELYLEDDLPWYIAVDLAKREYGIGEELKIIKGEKQK